MPCSANRTHLPGLGDTDGYGSGCYSTAIVARTVALVAVFMMDRFVRTLARVVGVGSAARLRFIFVTDSLPLVPDF